MRITTAKGKTEQCLAFERDTGVRARFPAFSAIEGSCQEGSLHGPLT